MDDTLKRIKEDMKNSFISVDTFNNKRQATDDMILRNMQRQ